MATSRAYDEGYKDGQADAIQRMAELKKRNMQLQGIAASRSDRLVDLESDARAKMETINKMDELLAAAEARAEAAEENLAARTEELRNANAGALALLDDLDERDKRIAELDAGLTLRELQIEGAACDVVAAKAERDGLRELLAIVGRSIETQEVEGLDLSEFGMDEWVAINITCREAKRIKAALRGEEGT